MTAANFDTHFFIKKLTSQGMPEKQAEAVVDFVRETKEADLNVVASKADLQSLRGELKSDMRELELRLENKITEKTSDIRASIIQWMIGLMFMQAGLIMAMFKLFLAK